MPAEEVRGNAVQERRHGINPHCWRSTSGHILDAHNGPRGAIHAGIRAGCPNRRRTMATFISLLNFTDQGIRNVKDSPDRYGTFRVIAERLGVTVKGIYYTIGHHDMVLILEGTEEAVTTALLKAGSL